MSKKRVCDICGAELTHQITPCYYKFKRKGWNWDGTPMISSDFEMCWGCYFEFREYLQNKKHQKSVEPKPPKGRTAIQDF